MSKRRRRTSYDKIFKYSVIEEYLSSGLNQSSFCLEKGLDRTTFSKWLRTFESELSMQEEMSHSNGQSESEEIRELKHQLRVKEAELKKEKMRADFYETMVAVAEEQFNITIRKKAGTKQ